MQENITARSITLRNENGGWLGQVVLTSDGMFAAVTDYGNFSFSWRSIGSCTFEDFIIGLGEDYFAGKMVNSLSYILLNKKIDKAADVFTRKILPALQAYLRKEKIAPQSIAEQAGTVVQYIKHGATSFDVGMPESHSDKSRRVSRPD